MLKKAGNSEYPQEQGLTLALEAVSLEKKKRASMTPSSTTANRLSGHRLLLAIIAAFMPIASHAATAATTLTFPPRAMLADVPRVGLNMGSWSFYGSDQIMSNVLKNPGFEGVLDRMIILTREAAGRYVADDELRLGAADHFWDGARYEVVTGSASGQKGLVRSSKRQGESGYPEYTLDQPTFRIGVNDAVVLTKQTLPAKPPNWWVSPENEANLRLATAGNRSGSQGRSYLRMTMPDLAQTEIFSFLDSSGAPAGRLMPINGKWRVSVWLKAVTGAPKVRISLARGSSRFFEQSFAPGKDWQQYTLEFSGKEIPITGESASLQFTLSGSGIGTEVAVDDLYLGPNTPEAFRPEVVAMLQRLRPGYLRDWQGQLADTVANRLAASGARQSSRIHWDEGGQYHYGLDEFVDLCARVGAMPWIIIPSTVTQSELPLLADFMRRKQRQHHFKRWVVEYGNENWNGLFRPAALTNDAIHAERVLTLFSGLRKLLPGLPLQPLINAQSAWPERSAPEARSARQVQGALAIAPYYFDTLNNAQDDQSVLSGLFPSDEARILQGFRKLMPATPPWLYEYNLHTDKGDASLAKRERAVAGVAAGLSLAARAMSFYDQGVVNHAVYSFSQIHGLVNGKTVDNSKLMPLWGITRDFAFPTMRPSGLALELMNRAVGGKQYRLVCQPSPTACRQLVTLGFAENGHYSVVLSNKTGLARTVTLNWPGQQPPTRWFTLGDSSGANSLWANNENPVAGKPSAVQIADKPLRVAGKQLTLQIPAYGLAVITDKSP